MNYAHKSISNLCVCLLSWIIALLAIKSWITQIGVFLTDVPAFYQPIHAIKWKTHNLTHRRFFRDNDDILFCTLSSFFDVITIHIDAPIFLYQCGRMICLILWGTSWPLISPPGRSKIFFHPYTCRDWEIGENLMLQDPLKDGAVWLVDRIYMTSFWCNFKFTTKITPFAQNREYICVKPIRCISNWIENSIMWVMTHARNYLFIANYGVIIVFFGMFFPAIVFKLNFHGDSYMKRFFACFSILFQLVTGFWKGIYKN